MPPTSSYDILEDVTASTVFPNQTNSTGTPDEDSLCKNFKFVLYVVFCGTICTMGLIGNFTAIFVLHKDSSSPVATFLLKTLAIADNCFLAVWLIHYSIRELLGEEIIKTSAIYMYVRVYTFPIMYMAQMETIALTVVIAFNRFVAVCIPYKAQHLCNLCMMYKMVTCVTAFSILYNIPRFFDLKVEKNNDGLLTAVRPKFWTETVYQKLYIEILYYLLTFILPLITLTIVNLCVIKAYRASQRRKRRMTKSGLKKKAENENNITLVMIAVVGVFLICQAPARIVQMIWHYKFKNCSDIQFFLIHISNTLEILNSSVNFFIYFMFRKRFRDIIWETCKSSRGKVPSSPTTEGIALTEYNRINTVKSSLPENDNNSMKKYNKILEKTTNQHIITAEINYDSSTANNIHHSPVNSDDL